MKNNIKKASVKFWEDLLYFSILCRFLSFPQIGDYHHLKQFWSIHEVCALCDAEFVKEPQLLEKPLNQKHAGDMGIYL